MADVLLRRGGLIGSYELRTYDDQPSFSASPSANSGLLGAAPIGYPTAQHCIYFNQSHSVPFDYDQQPVTPAGSWPLQQDYLAHVPSTDGRNEGNQFSYVSESLDPQDDLEEQDIELASSACSRIFNAPAGLQRQFPYNMTPVMPSSSIPMSVTSSRPSRSHLLSRKRSISCSEENQDLDCTDPETKRTRFLARNREATTRCRQKKKHWQADLEVRARELGDERKKLNTCIQNLREELIDLKDICLRHDDCDCTDIRQYLQMALVNARPSQAVYADLLAIEGMAGPC